MTPEDKIRKRKSYEMFDNISKAFDASKQEGLNTVFHIMDNQCMFRSATRASYAQESLKQLLKDKSQIL